MGFTGFYNRLSYEVLRPGSGYRIRYEKGVLDVWMLSGKHVMTVIRDGEVRVHSESHAFEIMKRIAWGEEDYDAFD